MRARGDDGGSAVIEFVFVAVVVMVPLVYLVAAVATVQRTNLAVTAAAREAGRAYVTSDTAAEAARRTRAAVRLALHDQGLADDDRVDVRVVPAGADCTADPIAPSLQPGAEFAVCVSRRVELPGVPSILAGRGIRSVGVFVVHVDDYRAAPPMTEHDRGSTIPLILGFFVIALLMIGGSVALGQAFVQQRDLQSICDGAAAAAAASGGDLDRGVDVGSRDSLRFDDVDREVARYLARDRSRQAVTARVTLSRDRTRVTLRCAQTLPLTFGRLVGRPTVRHTAESTSRAAVVP